MFLIKKYKFLKTFSSSTGYNKCSFLKFEILHEFYEKKHKIIKVLQNFCRGCRSSNPLLWYLVKKEHAKLTYLLEKTFFFLTKSKRSSNFLWLWRYMRLKFECLKQDQFLKTQCRERVNNDIFLKKMRLFMTFLKTDVISIKNM